MNLTNYIEVKYKELESYLNYEYVDLYKKFNNERLEEIFSTLHHIITRNYDAMNSRLPTNENPNHFWAENSRELIMAIENINNLEKSLKDTFYSFYVDDYYKEIINISKKFLEKSGGSEIPPHTEKVLLYYTIPIFIKSDTIQIKKQDEMKTYTKKFIGEGSYANVYKYKDEEYNKYFVIKSAKKDLSINELERFKKEFEITKQLNSPYIIETYTYHNTTNEYIMEYMDYTLYDYINKYNSSLKDNVRKSLVNQVLRGFEYIHSKNILHRDISPKNILLKIYDDDTIIAKIADFGLVKIADSLMTSKNTEIKGWFNDPQLEIDGFQNYNIRHEMYALTRLIYFIYTGKVSIENVKTTKYKGFIEKGLSPNKDKRFNSVREIAEYLKNI